MANDLEKTNMANSNLEELYQIIYRYYPRHCDYSSGEYQKSEQYIRLKDILENYKQWIRKDKLMYSNLDAAFPNNYIKKWTSVDYPSIHYTILLHENQPLMDDDEILLEILNNRRLDLEVYISLLGNYYYAFVCEMKKEHEKLSFACYQDDIFTPEYAAKLSKCMNQLGYCRLDSATVHCRVPDVNTDLKDADETTIFQCLFSDLESFY